MSSAKWRPFCLGLNVLKTTRIKPVFTFVILYKWVDTKSYSYDIQDRHVSINQ